MSATQELREKHSALLTEYGEIGGHIKALQLRRSQIGNNILHLIEAARLFGEELPRPFPVVGRLPKVGGRSTVRDFAVSALSLHPDGIKATALRHQYQEAYSVVLHEKTLGMTLNRLSKDGLCVRRGHTWYPLSAAAS